MTPADLPADVRLAVAVEVLNEAKRQLCQGCAEGWPWYGWRKGKRRRVPIHHRDPEGKPMKCDALELRRVIAGPGRPS